jgi:hypothetical protein
LFTKVFFFFLKFGAFSWGGESGVEWSFNISLQEHIHSPAKASCLLVLWHFEASPGGHEATCPFTGCRAHSALRGDGALAHFVFWTPQAQQVPPSEMSTQLLLGKRGGISSGYFLLIVGGKGGRCRGTLLGGCLMWSPGDSDRTLQRAHA